MHDGSLFDVRGPEPDVVRIRRNLRNHATIIYRCFNRAEVDEIKAQLTEEEKARVKFTWLVWGGAS